MSRDLCGTCGLGLVVFAGEDSATCGECRQAPGECGCPPLDPAARDTGNADASDLPDLPDLDLGELAAAGVQPPELICKDMLYAGGIHTLAGQPGGGKTTVMAWLMLQHIRDGGNVMLLDEESGPEMVAEKFLDLGATAGELRSPGFSYVPFPGRGWNATDVAQLHERVASRRPGIIGWDSAAEFLSIAGQDENSAADVTRFWKRVLKPCAREYGAAVIAIDHTGKGAEHGGYGRGSGAKKAASDVQYMIETVKPFNRTQDGILKLTTSPGKDRRGWLGAGYRIHVAVHPVLSLSITELGEDETGAAADRPPAQAKILAVLGSEPITTKVIGDRLAARFGHGLRRETISRELSKLLKTCDVDRLDAPDGRTALWSVPNAL